MEDGGEQVALEFTLQDNTFTEIRYTTLQYKNEDYLAPDSDAAAKICGQFDQLLKHLVGKTVSSLSDLCLPGQIADDTDVSTGATLPPPKVISAIWDALDRPPYVLIQ